MHQEEFEVGDVVELNSGSPSMTVAFVNEKDKNVSAVMWVESQLIFREGIFGFSVLNNLSK